MNGNSNYRETYKWHTKPYLKRQKPIRHSDNLKTEISLFTAKSRYQTDFKEFTNYKRDKSNFAPDKSFRPEKALKTESMYVIIQLLIMITTHQKKWKGVQPRATADAF